MEQTTHAVILAAGVGKRLGLLDQPKCLVEVGGRTLMDRHLEHLGAAGIKDVTIVVGHGGEQIQDRFGANRGNLVIQYVANPDYHRGSVISLLLGLYAQPLDQSTLWMDADVLYPAKMLADLAAATGELTFLLDPTSDDTGEEMVLGVTGDRVLRIDRGGAPGFDLEGESVGFFHLSEPLRIRFIAHLEHFINTGGGDDEYEAAVNSILPKIEARYISVAGLPWTEIDFPEDLVKAEQVLKALSV